MYILLVSSILAIVLTAQFITNAMMNRCIINPLKYSIDKYQSEYKSKAFGVIYFVNSNNHPYNFIYFDEHGSNLTRFDNQYG